ncbi:hypothetical protein HZC33_03065 [Candidatus Wolfebacteria bacterium]|nr:hypothetical protein [Candidatus Wolfebacteria bacterium]
MKIPSAKSNKKFLAFLAICAIIGSVIYIYSGLNVAKAYSFFAPINTFAKEKIVEPVKKAAISGKNSVENKFKQASADLIDINTAEVKDNAFSAVKNGMNNGMNTIGKLIGVDEKIISQNQKIENNQNCKQ